MKNVILICALLVTSTNIYAGDSIIHSGDDNIDIAVNLKDKYIDITSKHTVETGRVGFSCNYDDGKYYELSKVVKIAKIDYAYEVDKDKKIWVTKEAREVTSLQTLQKAFNIFCK